MDLLHVLGYASDESDQGSNNENKIKIDNNVEQHPSQSEHEANGPLLKRQKKNEFNEEKWSNSVLSPSSSSSSRKTKPPVKSTSFVRQVPHVRGNWSGHVFFPIDPGSSTSTSSGTNHLRKLVRFRWDRLRRALATEPEASETATTKPSMTPTATDQLHVSLSRAFYLQEGAVFPFVEDLKRRLKLCLSGDTVPVVPVLTFDTGAPLKVLVNDDRNRTFVVVAATDAWKFSRSTNLVLSAVDDVLRGNGRSTYHEEEGGPVLHVSLASTVGDASAYFLERPHLLTVNGDDDTNNNTNEENSGTENDSDNDDQSPVIPQFLYLKFDTVRCVFGKVKTIDIRLV